MCHPHPQHYVIIVISTKIYLLEAMLAILQILLAIWWMREA
jgi:hypothetical protein